ncbi:MAG TPA: hypothetical protein VMM60_03110 [Ilumatobacter sp.]|nr:hypothetical protein [Ilumatobacter sp.]
MSWLPLFHRPATSPLAIAMLLVAAGWALHAWQRWATRPERALASGSTKPAPLGDLSLESPAVVALITNDFAVPASAITATLLDLAAKAWVRLTVANGELIVVARPAGDHLEQLLPFEQQVFNHARARAFNDVTSANTLAASRDRLDQSWRNRFARSVGNDAQQHGLTLPRYPIQRWVPEVVAAVLAALALVWSWRNATDVGVQEGWEPRVLWLATAAAVIALGVATNRRVRSAAQTPTAAGLQRSGEWLGYRARLQARIPVSASVIGVPDQQRALAYAVGMGVATHVQQELPVAPDDPRNAWSEAGGTSHTVRVRYPFRPGYGQRPLKVLAVGLIGGVALGVLRGYLRDIADGEALASVLDNSPGQVGLFRDFAAALAVLCLIPLAASIWAIIAGSIDSVITRERVGVVVRTRHPAEVIPAAVASLLNPFAGRADLSMYLAVDDGTRRTVNAWVADGRSTAPEGAQARVRATPLLGFVRSSEPVGTSTR